MKRVLLTGGTGFVGANLARRLIREGHDVHLLVRPDMSPWRIEEIRDGIRLHEVELADESAVNTAVQEIRPDWVFHLAAHGAYSWQTGLQQIMRTNVTGTVNLVHACLRVGFEAFINTGSSSEYGAKDHAPSEQEWIDPNSEYAVTKAFATQFCRFTALRHALPLITVRLYSVYGPYEDPMRLISSVIVRGLAGALPPLVRPDIARDYVHVEDVERAYLLAAQGADQAPRGAVYNVGTGTQTTLRQVVNVARRMLPIREEPSWGSLADRQWDTDVWVADSARIRSELGWYPSHAFEDGFRRTVEWFRADETRAAWYRAQMGTP